MIEEKEQSPGTSHDGNEISSNISSSLVERCLVTETPSR